MEEKKVEKTILVTQSSMPTLEEYVEEIQDIWHTHWLTNMGEKHQKLQRELTNYLKVENVELLTNGHMALELTLQALGGEGEVITTPFTFISTTHAIVRNGLTPVFCDINYNDYTIDVTKIEELITDRTCAILPVHVYGNVCNVEEIDRIAQKYNLKVIYDAAHAFGVEYKGKGIGEFGDASCFSFHATKVFNTIEGGAVTYRDKKLGEELYRLKNFGIRGPECVDGIGANAKMNEFCAAMGLCNMKHIDIEIGKREKVAQYYRERLEKIPGIKLLPIQKDVKTNYSYFPILVEKESFGKSRDEIFEFLKQRNILARKYFYPLTSRCDCYKGIYEKDMTPIALKVSENILTLPMYANLKEIDQEKICDVIENMGV